MSDNPEYAFFFTGEERQEYKPRPFIRLVKEELLDNAYLEIEKLRSLVAELESVRRWIPVEEQLPPVGKMVQVYSAIAVVHKYGYDKIAGFMNGEPVWRDWGHFVTHWMPIIPGPEDKDP